MRRLRTTQVWPILLLAAELAVFYRKVLFAPGTYTIPWDFHHYHYNLAQYLASALASGRLPLWDPYTYCGQPFFANLTAKVFYLPELAAAAVAAIIGLQHLHWLQTLALVGHIWWAGIGTYWLLREAKAGVTAALIGATAFQMGCYFASQTQHEGAVMGGAWLPMGALAVLKLANGAGYRWIAVLSLCVSGSILAGFPSTTAAVIFALLLLAVSLRAVRSTLIALVTGVALSAVQLLPTIQLSSLSVVKYRADFRAPGSGIRLEAIPSLIYPNYFHVLDLKGYSLPYNFTSLYLYCGLAVLFLAILAVSGKRHPLVIPFAALTGASALLMHGDATWPGRFLNPIVLTITRDSVYPEFFMVSFSFGMAVLAALGAERFAKRRWIPAAILLITIADLTVVASGRPMNTAVLAEEPGVTPWHFDGNVELLNQVRGLVNQSDPPVRIDTVDDSVSWSMMASTTRIPTANGNEPFALESIMTVRRIFCGGVRWGRYYEVVDLDSPILDQIGVRYLITRNPLPPSLKYSLVAEPPGHLIYENLTVSPRFYVARKSGDAPAPDSSVRVKRYLPETVELEVDSRYPGFLVTSEVDYPGWRAYVDGSPVQVSQTNIAFRGVEIPAGRHQVVFRFIPAILGWGAAISSIAVAFVALMTQHRR